MEVVAALKDLILDIFSRGVLAKAWVEAWVEAVTLVVLAGLPSIGVSLLAIKSSK